MTFSQRFGLISVRAALQGRSLDPTTRTRLWSALATTVPVTEDVRSPLNRTWMKQVYDEIWSECWKLPVDKVPRAQTDIRHQIKSVILDGSWHMVYDLLEFLINSQAFLNRATFSEAVSRILLEEMAGFRLLGNSFVEIADETEILAIEDAVLAANGDKFAPARTHLGIALKLLSSRTEPDYRNSIKESVSAVEAIVQILSGDKGADLGRGLQLLEKHTPLHGALRSALRSLYGYASDGDGIRHALSEQPNLDAADAKFMLVVCSAFVVYLIQHAT